MSKLKRQIYLGERFAGKIGRVINDRCVSSNGKTSAILGIVSVDENGYATYYVNSESRYKLLFKGEKPIYDEVGSIANYKQ